MPESSYYSGIRKDVEKVFTPCMSDNHVIIKLIVQNDDCYDEYKNSVLNDNGMIMKSVSEENIYINGDKE